MKKALFITLICLLCTIPVFGYEYNGKTIKPFSADQYTVDKNGQETMAGKVYFGDDAMRSDVNLEQGKEMITIYDLKSNTQYFINPQTKKYYESHIKPEDIEKWLGSDIKQSQTGSKGTEKIQGHKCDIHHATTTVKVLGFSQTTKSTQYISRKLNIAIKTVMEDGSIMEYRNISTKKPASKLFELPEGLTKTGNMMGVFMGGNDATRETNSNSQQTQQKQKKNSVPDPAKVLKGLFGK